MKKKTVKDEEGYLGTYDQIFGLHGLIQGQ